MDSRLRESVVYTGSLVDAERVWSALEGHGIPARVLAGGLGATYGTSSVPVVVRESDLAGAQEVLVASGLTQRAPGR